METGIKAGIQKATRNFVIEMLKNQMDDSTIIKLTKIKKKELEEIKKELNAISDTDASNINITQK